MSSDTLTPEVLWAQRSSKTDADKNFVYLTISVPDVPADKLKLELTPSAVTFTGYSNTLKRTYHVVLDLFAEINEKDSKVNHTARDIELKLIKKELNDEYWPRLLKDKKKVHFLKTDFDKWVDEDEQNEVADEDFSNFGGMGGMPGMGGGGDFGGIDFSKLGGGAGDADFGADEDEEDGDMPALEGDDDEADVEEVIETPAAAAATAGKATEAPSTATKEAAAETTEAAAETKA